MIVYQATKDRFLDDTFKRDIHEVILESYRARTGRNVGRSEIASWRESLVCMAKVLNDEGIPGDAGIAIEYGIPQTAKRVDFILTGSCAEKNPNVIIVELKQWSVATRTQKDGVVITRLSGREQEVSHPSYQAWSYAALLNGFNEAVYDGDMSLQPCAYLHNYVPDDVITHEAYSHYIEKAPVFLKGELERKKLRDFIKRYVKYGDKAGLLYKIENGRIRPSKTLVESLAGMIRGNQEFILIDDQKVVYETALALAKQASDKQKKVFLVEGGPGTGKSVLAVNLLVSLSKLGLVCRYVSKNAAPRSVYESKLTGVLRRTEISNLFSGSGAFTETDSNAYDTLIVDEAHRLNEKSGLYQNLGENQIKELISAAKCTVFFIDEDQCVTLKDIGRKDEIRKWAGALGADVVEAALSSQFRCNGSDGYISWLDNTLQIRGTANGLLDAREFDFQVLDSPEAVRKTILEKNKANNKSRMVAGYCWPWNSKKNPQAMDVVIPEHGFEMQWNLSSDGSLWIVAPNSVDEIGCIHTSQGLEVDYIGVVVGPDLVARNGNVITRPEKRASSDRSIWGYKQLLKTDLVGTRSRVDEIIKNTYRTLMTRGIKGCYVYFTDAETADYFRSRMEVAHEKPVEVSLPASVPMNASTPMLPSLDEPFRRLQAHEVKPYENCVPLIDLKFAAGAFSETQLFDPSGCEWVELQSHFRPRPGFFVAQVIGESMNRRIPNGSWCLFRMNPTGTRQGKVVVAQHHGTMDPDLGGSFTVKLYRSEKVPAEDGGWLHERITLRPDSDDPKYSELSLDAKAMGSLRVVAEMIAVLGEASQSEGQ